MVACSAFVWLLHHSEFFEGAYPCACILVHCILYY